MSDPLVLGVSYSHNGAACLLRGDRIAVAIQEERLTGVKRARIRHHRDSLAVQYCLAHAGVTLDAIDALTVCHFSSASSPGVEVAMADGPLPRRYLTVPHHRGHAYAALATSGFASAAVLVIDGQGGLAAHLPADERAPVRRGVVPGQRLETEVISIYRADGDALTLVEQHTGEFLPGWTATASARRSLPRFGSLGGMYSAVAELIFGDPLEAGKVMGLAPYGQPRFPVAAFLELADDGLRYRDGLVDELRDLAPWPANAALFQDLAASVQAALEVAVLWLAARARQLTGADRLCYAGGVALNSVTNARIHAELGFTDVHVMPAAEDSGTAIGAAYAGLHALTGRLARRRLAHDSVGRSYTASECDRAIAATPGVVVTPCADLLDDVVARLEAGEIIGWFRGGSELGPRALGQRSILCDARRPDAKARLNDRVKHREAFRPFAPAILLEDVRAWFDVPEGFRDSPAMLRVLAFRPGCAERVPAAAHVDRTGRVQTVAEEPHGLRALLARFHARTGTPLLVNTSFNIAGEPIVETPDDALWCLLATDLDAVVLEDRLIQRAPAQRSILQLRPRLRATDVRLTFPIVDGALRLKVPADGDATITTATPLGALRHTVRATETALLGLCDGSRDGWQILAALQAAQPGLTATTLVRRLCFYRRGWVIEF